MKVVQAAIFRKTSLEYPWEGMLQSPTHNNLTKLQKISQLTIIEVAESF